MTFARQALAIGLWPFDNLKILAKRLGEQDRVRCQDPSCGSLRRFSWTPSSHLIGLEHIACLDRQFTSLGETD